MSGLMEKVGPIRFRARRHPLFQALTRAIVGARHAQQVETNIGAMNFRLSPAELAEFEP